MQLSLLPVFEWPVVIGVEGRTGEGDDEIDSVLRDSVRNSGPSKTPREKEKNHYSKRVKEAQQLKMTVFPSFLVLTQAALPTGVLAFFSNGRATDSQAVRQQT